MARTQIQIRQEQVRRPVELELRTPSGRPLPF